MFICLLVAFFFFFFCHDSTFQKRILGCHRVHHIGVIFTIFASKTTTTTKIPSTLCFLALPLWSPYLQNRSQSFIGLSQGPVDNSLGAKFVLLCFCKQSFTGTQPHSFVYILFMAASVLQWQKRVVVTATIWPTKPKICTTWSFAENAYRPLVQVVSNLVITSAGHTPRAPRSAHTPFTHKT